MQAIKTAYLCPTNVRGARIKASAAAGSITLGWNHALNIHENHLRAAKAFAAKLDWNGRWIGATVETKSDSFMVWACDGDAELAFVHANINSDGSCRK